MAGLTLDTGALIAYERGDVRVIEVLDVAFERGQVPTIPSIVVAEGWRGGPRAARIARLLQACWIEVLDERLAKEAGALMARTSDATIVDACVAAGAIRRHDAVVTSDPADMRSLMPAHLPVLRV